MRVDFLIVGQGLAGSILAWELIQRNARVVVVDNGRENASQVAAGLINPVTGLRFAKSYRVDDFLPMAKSLYDRLSALFKTDFYHEKTLIRLLRNESDIEQSKKRLTDPDYRGFLEKIIPEEQLDYGFQRCLGALEQRLTGFLDTRPLLATLRNFLIERDSYRKSEFDYRDITIDKHITWQGLIAKQIVCCEGYRLRENPWFSWLPLQPVKGEILTLQNPTPFPNKIVNFGNWLIPTGINRYRTGATFDRKPVDVVCTAQAKMQLLAALGEIAPDFKTHARVVEQQANIRPCTPDRLPFLGCHPIHRNLHVFNGFGAKGSLQIPWYSQHFADVLLKGTALEPDCDIQRYYATHFPRP
ncbi:MAG: hypothetical protein Kow0065_22560 [Methylomicrobium sp.]